MENEIQVDDKEKMVATLQTKKETLELKLREKTKELKLLCIQEAELTGVLPPETPLEPGEMPPSFRRRVGTAFTYPENLLSSNKLKSKEESVLAALELECKVQRSIADAALSLANDNMASKTIRRKHRAMYEQSRHRLTELETKLHHLQHNYHKNQLKHRKKPRPSNSSEAEAVENETTNLLSHAGINLSPLSQEDQLRNGLYWETNDPDALKTYSQCTLSPQDYPSRSEYSTASIPRHYHTDQRHIPLSRPGSSMYMRPDIHTNGGFNQNFSTLKSTHDDVDYKTDEVYRQQYSLPGSVTAWSPTKLSDQTGHQFDVNDIHLSHLIRPVNRFGNSDHYKILTHINNSHIQMGIYNGFNSETSSSVSNCKDMQPSNNSGDGALLPNQTYPDNMYLDIQNHLQYDGHKKFYPFYCNRLKSPREVFRDGGDYTDNKLYDIYGLNDRSETGSWNRENREPVHSNLKSNTHVDLNIDQLCISDPCKEGTYNRSILVPETNILSVSDKIKIPGDDTLRRKQREKQWQETSLDSNTTPLSDNSHTSEASFSENGVGENRVDALRTDRPDKILQNVRGDHGIIDIPVIEPSANHTVIQVGQWKPYREESKPFEMSDFYKYSTKFRKNKKEPQQQEQQHQYHQQQQSQLKQLQQEQQIYTLPQSYIYSNQFQQEGALSNNIPIMNEGSILHSNWKQRHIYQVMKTNPCSLPIARNKLISLGLPNSDTFVENTDGGLFPQTITWHQDDNNPCSATLV